MVITSGWGLGLISFERDTSLFLAPNGTRLGDWLLDTTNDRVRVIADLDGDGLDEIVITSAWGMGVLKMVGGQLRSVAMHPIGDNLGGWVVSHARTFALSDRLRGGAQQQLVITDAAGIHVLELSGSRLTRVAFAANGSRVRRMAGGHERHVAAAAGRGPERRRARRFHRP